MPMDRGLSPALGEVGASDPEGLEPQARRSPPASRSWGRPRVKTLVLAFVLLSVVGVVALAAIREATAPPARITTARPELAPPRPALTPAEEEYALALWPIHNEVKAGALKMTLGGLAYKLGEIDRAALKARIERSADTYRHAARQIAALAPPPSLRGAHEMYADAVRLYQRSADEMMLVVRDGRDAHLVAAQPLSMEASEKLLRVGDTLWPGEYKPN
jgi:hypothetical protein